MPSPYRTIVCVKCHMPTGHYRTHVRDLSIEQIEEVAIKGIALSCCRCHNIVILDITKAKAKDEAARRGRAKAKVYVIDKGST